MRPRYHDKPDTNAAEIIAFLRCHGYEVVRIDRPLDCLIYDATNGKAGMIEIKKQSRDTKFTRAQIEFIADTEMPVDFVKCEGEALIFAETMIGLSQRQKDALAVFLTRDKSKTWGPAVIERVLENATTS